MSTVIRGKPGATVELSGRLLRIVIRSRSRASSALACAMAISLPNASARHAAKGVQKWTYQRQLLSLIPKGDGQRSGV